MHDYFYSSIVAVWSVAYANYYDYSMATNLLGFLFGFFCWAVFPAK